jgi:carbonic anhydrase/acetyltransferase-like protein (isoleucine patch superfamily)
MLLRHRGREPTIDSSAFVAPTATLVGDVRIGPRARVMYGRSWTPKRHRSR